MAAGAITGVEIRPAPERASQPVLERLLSLAPALVRFGAAVVARLPPTSRLRRWVLRETFSRVFAAVNRGESWFVSVGYEPDCEIYPAAGFWGLGMAECYRGHSGWRQATDDVKEFLPDVRYTPEHLIDLGDRWVLRLDMSGSGRSSGVETSRTWGSIYHASARGRVARQDMYLSWQETLASAGLREDV
jgi:hypothetical protein